MNKAKEAKKTLERALKLLGPDGEHWIKCNWAKHKTDTTGEEDSYGEPIYKTRVRKLKGLSNNEWNFCSLGAIRAVDGPGERDAIKLLARAIRQDVSSSLTSNVNVITAYNDWALRTFKDVKAAFEDAIKLTKDLK